MQLKFLPSFVKRKGRITKRQELGLNELENFSISTIENINIEKEKFSQCHLEIGFGNAENLCSMAKSYPDILFIGSEAAFLYLDLLYVWSKYRLSNAHDKFIYHCSSLAVNLFLIKVC